MLTFLATAAGAIAACESDATVERAERRGFDRCSSADWRAIWQDNDMRRLAELRADVRGVEQVREVGRAWPPPGFSVYKR